MLIDVWREVGLDAIAQVDLDVHQNRHQPLRRSAPMAYAVLGGRATRLEREDRRCRSTAARSSSSSRAPWSTAT